jgi:hypothetical protein
MIRILVSKIYNINLVDQIKNKTLVAGDIFETFVSEIKNNILVQGRSILVLVSEPTPFFSSYDLLLESGPFILLENSTTRIRQEGYS